MLLWVLEKKEPYRGSQNGKIWEGDIHYYNDKKAGEIRADWYYVVAPGSYVAPDKDAAPDGNGSYQVLVDAPISKLEVRPRGITLKEDAPNREVNITRTQTWKNDLGMFLYDIHRKDAKLDNLLTGANECGYPSMSEADMAAALKLYFWV